MKAESANTDTRQPDYLKLGYEFSFTHGLRAVLFDRQSKEHSETLMSRVLGGFMEWSAGHWIAHHIKKQLPNEKISREFIRNIREQGGVSRDELVDFLSEAKIRNPKKEIFPSESILGGNARIHLTDAENVLKNHLTSKEKHNKYKNEFTEENISEFLKFVKNDCKIANPSDTEFIKELENFCEAFDSKRKNKEYSFFTLRNYWRFIFLKRELKFLNEINPSKSIKISKNYSKIDAKREKEYRDKLRLMPTVIGKILKKYENLATASYLRSSKSIDNTQEEKICFLKKINSRSFLQYFRLGYIDEKSRKELSMLVKSRDNLKKKISADLAAEDPLYIEILDDAIDRLKEDLDAQLKNIPATETLA